MAVKGFPRYIIFLIVILSFSLCKKSSNSQKLDEISPSVDAVKFNEIAFFLAGKDIASDSQLFSLCQQDFYIRYIKELRSGWNAFDQDNLQKIAQWWEMHAPAKYKKHIFYPFSGPDIMNALNLFPEGEEFLLFGLEPPGKVPELHSMSHGDIKRGLRNIRKSLNAILNYNFFRTKDMAKDLKKNSMSSITGLLMTFLALQDCTILDVQKIAIDSNSNISPWVQSDDSIEWLKPPPSKRIPGVEIVFKDSRGNKKRVRYFMLNVINWALEEHSTNFIPFIHKFGPCSTVVKAASYLMHADGFSKIRSAVIDNSYFIIQDDSGIPIRYFPDGVWDISYHGFYDKPIGLWPDRVQPDLKKNMKKYSTGILHFSYGYKFKDGKSNIITIQRKL